MITTDAGIILRDKTTIMCQIKIIELIMLIIFIYLLINYQLYLKQSDYMSEHEDLDLNRNMVQEKDLDQLYTTQTAVVEQKLQLLQRNLSNTLNQQLSDFVHEDSILNFTPMDIFQMPKLQYLQNMKNPCVFVKSKEGKRKLACFPYFILAGFPKCGTSDLYSRLAKHPHFIKPTEKEPHFWDNLFTLLFNTLPRHTLALYSGYMRTLTQTVQTSCLARPESHADQQKCPYISGDFSTWTAFDGHQWQLEQQNANLDEPMILIPHKLFHLNPNLKVIFILRNPVEAVFSNYRFNMRQSGNATDFHEKVQNAIEWWENCTRLLSERRCAYGLQYPAPITSLNPLGPHKGTDAVFPRDLFWRYTSIDRLRIYIYHIYIKDWLSVFPAESILYIKFEDFARNPVQTITNQVLPFLEMVESRNDTLEAMRDLNVDNKGVKSFKMLIKTRLLLRNYFRPHVEKLEHLLPNANFNWF